MAASEPERWPAAGRERALRRILLLLYLLGVMGATAELLLLGHVEDWIQLVPFVALGVATAAIVAAGLRPARRTLRAARLALILLAAAGAAGIWFHYRGNVEFELEAYPGLRGFPLLWEAMRGATPALAPGLLLQLALIGLAFTYRHPALRLDGDSGKDPSR